MSANPKNYYLHILHRKEENATGKGFFGGK